MAAPVIAGEFYYGTNCVRCGRFIEMALDDMKGAGPEAHVTGTSATDTCSACGHQARYYPHTFRRQRATVSRT
jgi:hypothetical protein